jgi:cytochrome c biogenesis protein
VVNVTLQSDRSTSLVKAVLSFLRSVRLTILLFLVLAVSAILGTLIPQGLTSAQYKAIYGDVAARLLLALGVTDLYHSVGFVGLLVILSLNLIACSLHRLPTTWKVFRTPQQPLSDGSGRMLSFSRAYDLDGEEQEVLELIRTSLGRRRWSVREERIGEQMHLMAQKGRYGRFGVFITHLGIMVILVGALLTFALGFKGYVQIEEGDMVRRVQDGTHGVWRDLDFQVRCDKFQVTFYPDGTPREYRSDVSFLRDGRVVMQGPLRVNHPLCFEGFDFFQSSYGVSSTITLEASDQDEAAPHQLQLALGETGKLDDRRNLYIRPLRYEPDHEGEGPAVLLAILWPGGHPVGGWTKKDGESLSALGWTFKLLEAKERYWTGLQVKRDPGAIPVWCGSGLVLIGCYLAFFVMHWRVWVRVGRSKGKRFCIVAASASKGREALINKVEELCHDLEESAGVRLREKPFGDG